MTGWGVRAADESLPKPAAPFPGFAFPEGRTRHIIRAGAEPLHAADLFAHVPAVALRL